MTVKLDLTPDLEATLASQARAAGLSLEAYVTQVLREKGNIWPTPVTGAAAKARAFAQWAHSHPHIPTLPEEAFRLEGLVRDAG